MPNYGVFATEKETSASTPVLANAGVPYFVGTAPVHTAAKPAKPLTPVLCTSWDEAVEKLGYSKDWKTYTLCEAMYSHFQLFQSQPAIFCNVLDPDKMSKGVQPATYALDTKRIATLPPTVKLPTLKVMVPDIEPDTQTYHIRPAGAAGENPNYDYPAGYEKAGVTLRDGGIFYAGEDTKNLDDELKHNGDGTRYYIGIVFDAPEGAKKVKVTGTGISGDSERNLEDGDSQDVLNGAPISYFSFADEHGKFVGEATIIREFEWKDGGEKTIGKTKCTICRGSCVHAERDTDYTAWNDETDGSAFVQCSADGILKAVKGITVEEDNVVPGDVTEDDIVAGIGAIDQCLSTCGIIPDLIAAPGWSHLASVSSVMAAKAENINGLFTGKAVIDIDTAEVTDYTKAIEYKSEHSLTDMNEIVCWPMVKLGTDVYHLSTQLCGLIAKTDTANGGIPYEAASNKALQMDGAVLADGTEVNLTHAQANQLRANGMVTAFNFMGWLAWGANTACYPANTDVKDYMIPVSRMFDYIKTTLIKTFWSKLDKPFTRRLVDSIVDASNIWLNGLVAAGYLLGARVEMLDAENPLSDLMQGICRFHVYVTPPSPLQECDFILEYDASYVEAAFS